MRLRDGSVDKSHDPVTLRWAIAPIEKGLEPLDIAQGRVVDLNVFYTIEGFALLSYATHADPRGIPLFLEPGDYRLQIVIYGDNFAPVKRHYAVHWDGEDYTKVEMQEVDEAADMATAWPFKSTKV